MKNVLKILVLFLAGALFAEQELEVKLMTKVPLHPIYVSGVRSVNEAAMKEYLDEMRDVLVYDLTNNGFSSVMPRSETVEQKIGSCTWKEEGDYLFLNQEHIPTLVSIEGGRDALQVTLVQTNKGSLKRYAPLSLQGKREKDRPTIHRFADNLQNDLFGVKGIASLRIIFSERLQNKTAASSEWVSDIWMADWDGANAERHTFSKGYCMSPGFFSSSGYYFVSSDRGQSKIYRGHISDSKVELWVQLRGNQMLPALSPDGSKLAFITDAAGRPDLFLQHIDAKGQCIGKPYQMFSAVNATQASPTFSPDGHRLAFVSDKQGSPQIYLLDISDARHTRRPLPKLISRANRENTSPHWSPDGKKLAYSARIDGVRQIWIYDFTNDQEWQLTKGPENKENPSWAPDSLHLIYNTETNDVSELYVINLNQQEPIKLNLGFGQKRFAAWEKR